MLRERGVKVDDPRVGSTAKTSITSFLDPNGVRLELVDFPWPARFLKKAMDDMEVIRRLLAARVTAIYMVVVALGVASGYAERNRQAVSGVGSSRHRVLSITSGIRRRMPSPLLKRWH